MAGFAGDLLSKGSDRLNRVLLGDDSVRLKPRSLVPFVWLVLLLAISLLLPHRVWTTLLFALLGLIVVAAIWAGSLARNVSASRKLLYGWVSVGDRLTEEFVIRNRSPLAALWVEIADESNVPGYSVAAARTVGGGELVRWRQSAVCTRRGQYRLGPWEIRTADPFGFFVISRRLATTDEIVIHPPVHGALSIPLPPGRADGRTRARERVFRATANVASVRDYHLLDPYSWIHWPTTARKDALFVRQFEQDAAGDIWILIDCNAGVHLGEGAGGTEEHAVLLAASLTAHALADHRGIGLAGYGNSPRIVPPALGDKQQWRILRALALLRTDGRFPLKRALQELGDTARRGSAALIITPSSELDWLPQLVRLARRGIQPFVVLLDRRSFGGGANSEALRQSVTGLGFGCTVVRKEELGRPLIETERHGFWEFKVTGTGKAVAVRRPGE